jgi:hypothetical protein
MRFTPHTNPARYSRLATLLAGGAVLAALVIAAPVSTTPGFAQTVPSAPETLEPRADSGMTPPADLQMQGDFIVAQTPGHVLANNLIGATVVSADGEEIGPVSDLIIDTSREFVGVTVSVGGFLGIGDRDVGLPISAFVIAPDIEVTGTIPERGDPFAGPVSEIITTLNADQFERAPEFAALEEIPGLENGVPVSPNATPIREPQID